VLLTALTQTAVLLLGWALMSSGDCAVAFMLWLIWRCCAWVSRYDDGAVDREGREAEGMAELAAVDRA